MEESTLTIIKVYEYLEKVTPVNFDCGEICHKKCCKGSDKDGMLLLPGEEEIFRGNKNFTVYYDERYESYAVRCKGPCNRNERPLSCRIFPYFIYADKKTGKLSVAPDIRAIDFCPLLAEKYELDRKFLRALRITSLKLSADKEIYDYICRITEILTDFNCLDL